VLLLLLLLLLTRLAGSAFSASAGSAAVSAHAQLGLNIENQISKSNDKVAYHMIDFKKTRGAFATQEEKTDRERRGGSRSVEAAAGPAEANIL
jgi:hypothetical protein